MVRLLESDGDALIMNNHNSVQCCKGHKSLRWFGVACLLLLSSSNSTRAAGSLFVSSDSAIAGDTAAVITVGVAHDLPYAGLEFVLTFDTDNLLFNRLELDSTFALVDNVHFEMFSAGDIVFLVFDSSGADIPADSAVFIKLYLGVPPLTPEQPFDIVITQATAVTSNLGFDTVAVQNGVLNVIQPVPCCVGIRGNIRAPFDRPPDLEDLLALVDYLFWDSDPLACREEADLDDSAIWPDEGVDIVDIVYFVDFLWSGGPDPAPCP